MNTESMDRVWTPHVTVAAVAEREGRFLLVEEVRDGVRVINQPAGHLEEGESIEQATIRETLEESGWHFTAKGITGIYRGRNSAGITHLRFALYGEATHHEPERRLDEGIIGPLWLSRDELAANPRRLRSPMVLRTVDDYLAGQRHPLSLLTDLGDAPRD